MVEVVERQTGDFLKGKIIEVVMSYGIPISQVFSVTCDNGANMLAAVKSLKKDVAQSVLAVLGDDITDDDDFLDTDDTFIDALNQELENCLHLIRCAAHTLQLAILDVVNKSHESVKAVTAIAKKVRNVKYTTYLSHHGASKPGVFGQTRWAGIYEINASFVRQKAFFDDLSAQFPELDLCDHWEFIRNYEEAFKPLYVATKKLQAEHVSLGDFYILWLMATNEVRKLKSNPFAPQLLQSLSNRLVNLRKPMAFKAALYIDPRLNYFNSTLFSPVEKAQIQEFIINTWKRICALNPSDTAANECVPNPNDDDMAEYITELFGGSLGTENTERTSTFHQQLKTLEIEPRRPHNFNVWEYWVQRKSTHPELHAVAMVLLTVPSTQVSVERAFSALSLVLSDHRTTLGENTLSAILVIKLKYEAILPRLVQSDDI